VLYCTVLYCAVFGVNRYNKEHQAYNSVESEDSAVQYSTDRDSQGDSPTTRNTRHTILLTPKTAQYSTVQYSTVQDSGKATKTIIVKHDIIMNREQNTRDVTEKN
jgi:hypothetical protein